MKAFQFKVGDLTDIKAGHLIWRLDRKTSCGFITAGMIARGEIMADKTLLEIFIWAGLSERSAKIHSQKVVSFRLGK